MKKRIQLRLFIFAIVFAAVLGVSAVFAGSALADVKPIISLAMINDSQFESILHIYGKNYGNHYSLILTPYSDSKLFIIPDEYTYTLKACNHTKTGELDLWTFQTIHVPVCGGKAVGFHNKPHHIDVSNLFKPVWVLIRNMTGEDVELYLRRIDDHHFLTLEAGEHLDIILWKEDGIDYVYSFVACGGKLITGYYTPRQTPPLDLKCP
jgi:hypothetical protein